ncbi:MAG: hypothetical protein JSU94_16005 [Phycisphaerales bacterium]|nr:MAG: hypothetical protein JSU94_16005 [Phycisphaerales bacterium]
MFNDYARTAIDNCTFNNNSAEFGAGVYSYYSVGLTLTGCTFSGNFAEFGGGLCHKYSEISTVTDCIFSEHSGGEFGGGIYNYAGWGTVTGCTFSDNSSWWGGGLYNEYFNGSVINCTFSGNSTIEEGAGMYNLRGNPMVSGCTFNGNWSYSGGGMDNDECTVKVTNCAFTGNFAVYGGGGMDNFDSSVAISQCTFYANRGYYNDGGGIRDKASSSTVTNCILWGNTAPDYPQMSGTPTVMYSNVQGGWEGVGNIDVDPCCVNPGYWEDPCTNPDYYRDDIFVPGDYHLKSQAGRYDPTTQSWVHDDVTSPCIDAGNPTSPIGHEPFPNGGIVNMGAYGGTREAAKSHFGKPPCETIVAGDINGDCRIDFADFAFIARRWLQERTP